MIYLASPYSHPDAAVREQRFRAACRATAQLIEASHAVFSPIVHGHLLVAYGLRADWLFWEPFARRHLARCDRVLVLMIDGWRESVGIAAETRIAVEFGKPVGYVALTATGSPTLAHVANVENP